MKHTWLIAMVAMISFGLYGQELPKVVPPSPEASALSKFIDVPVSHYTGMPNISIPIYTIDVKGMQIPIQLSYHARGVQVSETAPRTGTGWSLQYGGSVSRQVRGKGDELLQFGYLANKQDFMTYSSNLNTRIGVNTKEDMDPSYDFYPDQFSFSAGGFSGKFVLSYIDEQPIIQSFGDVKVSYTRENGTSGKIDAFTLIDPKGNTYYFGKSKNGLRTGQDYQDSVGMSIYNSGNVETDLPSSSDTTVYSAWKLMDVETPNGELISYYYEGEFGANSAGIYYRKSYDKHNPPPGTTVTNSAAGMNDINAIHTRLSKIWNYEKQLSKIVFNQGRDSIVFIKSNQLREDFEGHSLDKISVYFEDNLVKSFKLNYNYTTSTDQSNLLWYFKNNTVFTKSFKRMFLSSIEEEGINGQKLPPHIFTYNSTILPNRFSTAQDYWGYYNDAYDNGPFLRMFEYGNYTPDRRVNIEKSEAGLLKEIKYPTGGITKLTYEHNIGMAPSFYSGVKVPSINPTSQSQVSTVLTKSDFTYNSTTGSYQPLTLTFPNTIATYKVECFHLRDVNGDPNIPDCIFDFTMDGAAMEIGTYVDFSTCNDNTYIFNVIPKNTPGVDPNLHLDSDYDFQIHITYNNPDSPDLLYAAGKRLKKIEHISEQGNIVKEYEYMFPADTTVAGSVSSPSGAIIGLPAYINKELLPNDPCGVHLTTYNDATSAYGSYQPNTIGYSFVTEYLGTKINNTGKTEYIFTNISDSGGDYYKFPYHPPTDNEWLRGKNIYTKIYKLNQNNSYSLRKQVYNKYRYGDNIYTADFEYAGLLSFNFVFTPDGIINGWNTNTPLDSNFTRTNFKLPLFMRERYDPQNVNYVPGYRIYHLTGGTVNIHSTLEKSYDTSGTIEKLTTYQYDYPKHYQVKSSTTTGSDDEELKTTYFYPTDASQLSGLSSTATTAVNSLLSQNRFEVLQTEVYKDNVLQSTLRTNYKTFATRILPEKVQASKGSQTLEDRIEYEGYDTKGNIQEVKKTDGTSIYYIWGYDQTFPIAKLENFTQSDANALSGLISTAQLASDNDDSEADENALRVALANIRNHSVASKAQVTTFTYDPLIGVTSITDPRGRTVYYHYDAFNRLDYVEDQEGKILSKNTYHYKTN